VTLFAYYLFWIFGTTYDTNVQEDVYEIEAALSPLPATAVLLMFLFGAVAALLLWAASNDKLFSISLDIFFFFNIGGLFYVQWYVTPIIKKSRQSYDSRRKYTERIELSIVSDYMLGNWHWLRFLIGGIVLTVLNLVSFNRSIATWISVAPVPWLPPFSTGRVLDLLPSLLLLLFVLLMEGWIWYKRIVMIVSLSLINRLNDGYSIEPKSA
jgi:hypothetical protein